jgi:hypothetical protein
MGVDCDALKAEAAKRVKVSLEAEAPKKKKAVSTGLGGAWSGLSLV